MFNGDGARVLAILCCLRALTKRFVYTLSDVVKPATLQTSSKSRKSCRDVRSQSIIQGKVGNMLVIYAGVWCCITCYHFL